MKIKYIAIFPIFLCVFLAACMNVDSKVAKSPSVYWKAPKDAMPEKNIPISNILTDKIDNSDDKLSVSDKIDAGIKLSLTDLLDIALQNNPQTRMYWFQAKIYAARKGMVDASYYPTVSVGGSLSRYKYRSATMAPLPSVGSFYETGYGASLEINWLLYDFGKREAYSMAAKESLRAANFDYNQVMQDMFLQVNEAYFSLYEAKESKKAVEATLEDAQTSYKSADARFKEGVGNKQDMLRALANAKNAEYDLQRSVALIEARRAALANAIGIEISANLDVDENVVVLTDEKTSQKIDELINSALQRRPNVLAAYAKLRAAEQDSEAKKRNYLPTIGAVASGSWANYFSSPYTGLPNYNYGAGLQLQWDIFDGFNRKYELIAARATERAKAQELRAMEVQIAASVWANYYAYQSALKQIVSAVSAVDANEEACNATKAGYENGVNSLTDLLDAQSSLARARQQKVSADASLSLSLARLAHSTGSLISADDSSEE